MQRKWFFVYTEIFFRVTGLSVYEGEASGFQRTSRLRAALCLQWIPIRTMKLISLKTVFSWRALFIFALRLYPKSVWKLESQGYVPWGLNQQLCKTSVSGCMTNIVCCLHFKDPNVPLPADSTSCKWIPDAFNRDLSIYIETCFQRTLHNCLKLMWHWTAKRHTDETNR